MGYTAEISYSLHMKESHIEQHPAAKTATLHGNFTTTASATLLICIFNTAALCAQSYAVRCLFVQILCIVK